VSDIAKIIQADSADRRALFEETALRIGCAPANVEKDFWVCWTLDALFNKITIKPRLLFKGGTSLSKAFGLIKRFSEDIDVTVFRTDLDGVDFPTDDDFRAMGRRPREACLDKLRAACQGFIAGPFADAVSAHAADELDGMKFSFESDQDDPDGQTLLFHYPSVFPGGRHDYVRRVVKIESGARSALEPNGMSSIKPYVAGELPDFELEIPNVRTAAPIRTFWDKIVILHGQRRWFENRGEPYRNADRMSRHYYDIHSMLSMDFGRDALVDLAMAEDCALHARTYFNRGPFDLDSASPGSFALVPPAGMLPFVEADYEKMAGMVFGKSPRFAEVIEAIASAEATLNEAVPALVGR